MLGTAINALYKLFFQRCCFAGVAPGITDDAAITAVFVSKIAIGCMKDAANFKKLSLLSKSSCHSNAILFGSKDPNTNTPT